MQNTDRTGDGQGESGAFLPSLLKTLREGTHAAHERIEVLPELACLLSDSLSQAAYIAALRGLYQFQSCLHTILPPLLGDVVGLCGPDPAVLAALNEDIAWFGAVLPPPVVAPRDIRDAWSALGALYVLEGSALGGRVIGRAVARSLSVAPGRGGSFFCGASADNARSRWASFCAVLQCAGNRSDCAAQARVVDGALASFAYLEALLSGHRCAATDRQRHGSWARMPKMAPFPDGSAARNMI
jgi:heme oxygenase